MACWRRVHERRLEARTTTYGRVLETIQDTTTTTLVSKGRRKACSWARQSAGRQEIHLGEGHDSLLSMRGGAWQRLAEEWFVALFELNPVPAPSSSVNTDH